MQGSRVVLHDVFKAWPRGRVLDFGGGDGAGAALVEALGHKVVIVDTDEAAVAEARRRGIEAHVGGLEVVPKLGGGFDYAILSHVVEHFQAPHEELLPLVFNALRPGGRAYVAVPNVAKPENRLGLLRGLFSDGLYYQHVRFFTHDTLDQEMSRVGFRRVSRHRFGYTAITRALSRLSPGLSDEVIATFERPHGSADAPVGGRSWTHTSNPA